MHLASEFYDQSRAARGRGALYPIEEASSPPVAPDGSAGLRVLHLQCHFGADSSCSRSAAPRSSASTSRSRRSQRRARARRRGRARRPLALRLAPTSTTPGTCLPEPECFDVVYTTWGTIGWLPDVAEWARIIAWFLKPGGRLYFADGHPAAFVFEAEHGSKSFRRSPTRTTPRAGPTSSTRRPTTRTPMPLVANSVTWEWTHPLSETVTALLDAGLRLDFLHEHYEVPWQMFGILEPTDAGPVALAGRTLAAARLQRRGDEGLMALGVSVLVTGGTGTLGRRVVPRLVDAGCSVRVLSRTAHEPDDGVEYVLGDLASGEGLESAMRGIDYRRPLRRNAKGDDIKTRHLIEAASEAGVKHLVYISVVGADRLPVTERHRSRDVRLLRRQAEVRATHRASGIPFTILRATQFQESMLAVVKGLASLVFVPAPTGSRFQPIAVDEVADRLVELALAEPAGLVAELGGPRIYPARRPRSQLPDGDRPAQAVHLDARARQSGGGAAGRRQPHARPRCRRTHLGGIPRPAGGVVWEHNAAGWSSSVARWAHNPEVAGSNPVPATNIDFGPRLTRGPNLFSGHLTRLGPIPAPKPKS